MRKQKRNTTLILFSIILVVLLSAIFFFTARTTGNATLPLSCGDGICFIGEECEWHGAESRTKLCDGTNNPLPLDKTCSRCKLIQGTPTCGDGICQSGESCEWNGALDRQMLCDRAQSVITQGKTCSGCKLYKGPNYVVRQRIGYNEFIEPSPGQELITQNTTFEAYMEELNDPKPNAFRIKYNDYISISANNEFKAAVTQTLAENKLVIIPVSSYNLDDQSFANTLYNLSLALNDMEPKEHIIINFFNEADLINTFQPWVYVENNPEICPPPSPLMTNPTSQASQEYLTHLQQRISLARTIIDDRIKFTANPAWAYDSLFFTHCPAWNGIPLDTINKRYTRYNAYFTAINPYLDYLAFNYYPITTAEELSPITQRLTTDFNKPIIITETVKRLGTADVTDTERKETLEQQLSLAQKLPEIPLIMIYYSRGGDYGFKTVDGTQKASYVAIPTYQDIPTNTKPSWCTKSYEENGHEVCDINYILATQ